MWTASWTPAAANSEPRASRRRSSTANAAPARARLASRLVTGIRLRNFLTYVNSYYDDMAWLALATLRLEHLAEESRRPSRRRNGRIRKSLTLQFDSASTDDLGGGTFWSTKRDFKNTPATAPVALYYARTGNPARAQALLDWLDAKLFDPGRGLYLDGLRINAAGEAVLVDAIYTYNQGPVLGALLELGGTANLARAAAVVDAVARHLTGADRRRHTAAGTAPDRGSAVLRCDGTGDGGLFTGILARYLALAAADGRLPGATRQPPPRWSGTPPRHSGRAGESHPAKPLAIPGRRGSQLFSLPSRHCRRAAPIRRAAPSNSPPSSRPG